MMWRIEICRVKDNIGYRIRKLRESKDYSQENMAGELGLSISAYSKIERGVTDPSVGRVTAIAEILDVDVSYFFTETIKAEDPKEKYGFATKDDIATLLGMINSIKNELIHLKNNSKPATPAKQKKK